VAVNWQNGLVNTGLGAIEAFNAGRGARMQENQLRQQEQQRVRQEQMRSQASQQLSTGNVSGAQQTAIAGGDFDFAKAIGGYSKDQRDQLDAEAETLGRFAVSLKGAPVEQRRQAFAQSVGALRGQFSPEEIRQRYDELEQNGWSDAALDGYVGQAISVKDALAQATKANEQYTLAPGSARYDARGQLIVAQPFAPQLRSVGEGQTLVEVQPGGGGPVSSGGDVLSAMLPITMASESGGRDYAPGGGLLTSPAGARGRMQVMPGTQGDPGFGVRPAQNNTPDEIARVGADYLAAMVQRYGDPAKAWAAYNAGPGAVDKALASGGDWLSRMPAETRAYVSKNVARLGGGGGSTRVVAQGAPKSSSGSWQTLSQGEATAAGLPAGPVYQRGPNGEVKAVTGTANAGAGGSGLTKTQEGVVRTKLQSIQSIRSQLGRVKAAMKGLDKKGWTGSLGGLVPGAFDAESDRFDKAVAGLAPLIRQLTRVPGEGGMSDWESRLANAVLPGRRDTTAGRNEALAGLDDLLRTTESGYRELIGGGQSAPARSAPASGGGWGQARRVK